MGFLFCCLSGNLYLFVMPFLSKKSHISSHSPLCICFLFLLPYLYYFFYELLFMFRVALCLHFLRMWQCIFPLQDNSRLIWLLFSSLLFFSLILPRPPFLFPLSHRSIQMINSSSRGYLRICSEVYLRTCLDWLVISAVLSLSEGKILQDFFLRETEV
jgi:hypothetical protein